jgi:tRNA(Ile)-lysidine synthase
MTGHTMDDLAETVLINVMRGAGIDGLSPMIGDATKPLIALRRSELREVVHEARREVAIDTTNVDVKMLRNRVRLEILPSLERAAGRDLVPVIARQAALIADDRNWLDDLSRENQHGLSDVDCREMRHWPVAKARRWLRERLRVDSADGSHPPSADEIDRAMAVVRGEVVATELSGGRRLARRHNRLSLS